MREDELYYALMAYTLELRDQAFIHQHVVDAYTAQHAVKNSKPMGVVFALVGLYLHVEKGFTGRQVQRVHMELACRKEWPRMEVPLDFGLIDVGDVMAATAGPERDRQIHDWCRSVWEAWKGSRSQIVDLVKNELGIL